MSSSIKPRPLRSQQELSRFEKRIKENVKSTKMVRSLVKAYKNGVKFVNHAESFHCNTAEELFSWELKNCTMDTYKIRLLRALELGVDLSKMDKEEVFVTGIKKRSR